MGRVSLTEAYDDRSVISKLNEMDKRVTENTTVVTSAEASAKASAQSAQETADRFAGSVGAVVQNANAQINASKAQVDQAKAEVDETVTTVAQAVQTANDASASAQQSATTVAGYDARLTATESKNSQQDTDIAALQTADGQNVKISRINEYAVGLTGNQSPIAGTKHFSSPIYHVTNIPLDSDGLYRESFTEYIEGTNKDIVGAVKYSNGYKTARRNDYVYNRVGNTNYTATLRLEITPTGNVKLIMLKEIDGTETSSVIATL